MSASLSQAYKRLARGVKRISVFISFNLLVRLEIADLSPYLIEISVERATGSYGTAAHGFGAHGMHTAQQICRAQLSTDHCSWRSADTLISSRRTATPLLIDVGITDCCSEDDAVPQAGW